nr:hypothetical protein [Angustibacter aerolatus]
MLALDGAQVGQDAAREAMRQVVAHLDEYAGSGGEHYAGALGKAGLAAVAQGLDATDLGGQDVVATLRGLQDADGRFADASAFGDYSNTFSQAFAILALQHFSTPTVDGAGPQALAFLDLQQCPAGGYRLDEAATACTDDSTADPDATAMALLAHASAGAPTPAALRGASLARRAAARRRRLRRGRPDVRRERQQHRARRAGPAGHRRHGPARGGPSLPHRPAVRLRRIVGAARRRRLRRVRPQHEDPDRPGPPGHDPGCAGPGGWHRRHRDRRRCRAERTCPGLRVAHHQHHHDERAQRHVEHGRRLGVPRCGRDRRARHDRRHRAARQRERPAAHRHRGGAARRHRHRPARSRRAGPAAGPGDPPTARTARVTSARRRRGVLTRFAALAAGLVALLASGLVAAPPRRPRPARAAPASPSSSTSARSAAPARAAPPGRRRPGSPR